MLPKKLAESWVRAALYMFTRSRLERVTAGDGKTLEARFGNTWLEWINLHSFTPTLALLSDSTPNLCACVTKWGNISFYFRSPNAIKGKLDNASTDFLAWYNLRQVGPNVHNGSSFSPPIWERGKIIKNCILFAYMIATASDPLYDSQKLTTLVSNEAPSYTRRKFSGTLDSLFFFSTSNTIPLYTTLQKDELKSESKKNGT